MQKTVGQLMIEDAVPEQLRAHMGVLDKKGVKTLLHNLFVTDPDKYAEVVKKLSDIGRTVSYRQGSSFSLDDIAAIKERDKIVNEVKKAVNAAVRDVTLDDDERRKKIKDILQKKALKMRDVIYSTLLAKKNPFALQVFSGSRGNPAQLNSLVGAQLVTMDSYGDPLPVPMLHSLSEGLDPAEYWAGTYGARKGLIQTKMATADSGYLGKQLSQAAHKMVVTEPDCGTQSGLVVLSDDKDNAGAVLAKDAGGYKAGTVLTPSKLAEIKKTDEKITVRSPITCRAHKGICQKCAGVRERGSFPPIGDIVGITAANALSERLSQSSLGSKHAATGGRSLSGLEYIEQLVSVPKVFKGAAAVASLDGRIKDVENAPQGGRYVIIGNQKHYTPPDQNLTVQIGDLVEAGDVLSDGIPNPSKIVEYKGVGEGRRYFADLLCKAFDEFGLYANRRNTELLARGLINHVRVTESDAGDYLPEDIVEYDTLAASYKPRYGSLKMAPKIAVGKYLEQPAMHYSIGTRVTKRVAKNLSDGGYDNVLAHAEPPPFVPEMHRALDVLGLSPDWLIQQAGFYTKRRLLESTHRGARSDVSSESYIPKMIVGEL